MDNYTNKIYFATMKFDQPQGGSMRIPAESPEHVDKILRAQFGHHKNFEIIQVIAEDEIKPTAFGGVEDTPIMQPDPMDDETPPSQRTH